MTEHRVLPDSQLHEPKGIVTAAAGEVYVADGLNSGDWIPLSADNVVGSVSCGWWDYEDTATSTTPIALTLAGTQYPLTNDGLGPNTNKTFALAGMVDIWNTTTNQFAFNSGNVLKVGDTVDLRVDMEIITTVGNTAFDVVLEAGVGITPYQLQIVNPINYKTSGTRDVSTTISMHIGNTLTLDNPARLLGRADTTGASVKVKGWYIRVLKNN